MALKGSVAPHPFPDQEYLTWKTKAMVKNLCFNFLSYAFRYNLIWNWLTCMVFCQISTFRRLEMLLLISFYLFILAKGVWKNHIWFRTYNKCSSNRGIVWISNVTGSDLWILINNFGPYHENFENVKNYLGALFTLTKLVLEKYLGGTQLESLKAE